MYHSLRNPALEWEQIKLPGLFKHTNNKKKNANHIKILIWIPWNSILQKNGRVAIELTMSLADWTKFKDSYFDIFKKNPPPTWLPTAVFRSILLLQGWKLDHKFRRLNNYEMRVLKRKYLVMWICDVSGSKRWPSRKSCSVWAWRYSGYS